MALELTTQLTFPPVAAHRVRSSKLKERLAEFQGGTPRREIALLESFGLTQSWSKRSTMSIIMAVVVVAAGCWLLLQARGFEWASGEPDWVVAAVALLFGLRQWRDARHEKSLESFYQRLDLANQRREKSRFVRELMTPIWAEKNGAKKPWWASGDDRDHECTMYVYSELDNLEYVIEKYRLGFMEPHNALRGLRTFYQRCYRPEFRERAWWCVRYSGYNQSTIATVRKVLKKFEHDHPSEASPTGPAITIETHSLVPRLAAAVGALWIFSKMIRTHSLTAG